jgi:sigma-B regulation protein RsbU (phosphoserine phosphatase)
MAPVSTVGGSTEQDHLSKVIFDYAAGILGEQDHDRLLLLNANMARDICGADRCTIWMLDDRRHELWTRVAHGMEQVRIPSDAGLIGACVTSNEVILVNDTQSDPRFLSRIDRQSSYVTQSVLVLPLQGVDGRVIGALQLLNKPGGFSTRDIHVLKLAAAYSGTAIETQRLRREAEAARIFYRELEIAHEVQERLLPEPPRGIIGLDYASFCRSAKSVGGDYFDFVELPQNRFVCTLGDVSGKGIPAAVLMASLQSSLRALLLQGFPEPAVLMKDFNRSVCTQSTPDRYSTLFFALVDMQSRKLLYVNAGQVPPMLLRKSGTIERLSEGGCPIGLLNFSKYEQGEILLEEDETLLCVSDGITEAANVEGELWGEEEVQNLLSNSSAFSCQDLVSRVAEAADAFAAGTDQADDMTIVAFRLHAPRI